MRRKSWLSSLALTGYLAAVSWAGTFGTVVPVGGHASDLALDPGRGVLYIANYTANRIDVMSLANNAIHTSINVASQPSSLSLSPDGHYLVVGHYGNFAPPSSSGNALTVIDLTSNGKQTFALGNPPLGVAFGIDNHVLIVTTSEFILFDPVSGTMQTLTTIPALTAKTLPQPAATFPPNIVAASIGVSGNGLKMYGLTDTFEFSYDVTSQQLNVVSYVSTPPQGPRVVSVNQDGSYYVSGWALNDPQGHLMAEFPNPLGILNIGSHAFDSKRGLIYAQIPEGTPTTTSSSSSSSGSSSPTTTTTANTTGPPILQIVDSDNLEVEQQIQLPENLAGKSVLSADSNTMYSISDSGVMVLQVGQLGQAPRVTASQEDVVFSGNFCNHSVASQQITIVDPGGGNTPFALSTTTQGLSISPAVGVTPATVKISADPNAFQNQKGSVAATINITSSAAVNIPQPIRVIVNLHDPDQSGVTTDVPGTLVDILADPARNQFYVLRQDKNQVLVFDGTSYQQIATLRTTNTPTQLAITFDQRYLLVGSNDSQIIPVFDLQTLQPLPPIYMPGGHYPKSIAASSNAILAACRVAGPTHTIDQVSVGTQSATQLPTLGIFNNSINIDTKLAASANGSSILAVEADGTVLLYDANAGTFTVSRKDYTALSGAYAASSYGQFVAGKNLLNSSLVSVGTLESGTGNPSGFAFVDQAGMRTTAPDAVSPGVIERVDLSHGITSSATRMAEAPLLPTTASAFTQTLAPLYNRNAIVNLTVSGFTVLPWGFDASVAPPQIGRVVNAADLTQPVAPGGLITIFGQQLSPVNAASQEIPLPTALGNSCLTVNGQPIPILFVSPTQVNAQLPYQATGNVTLILRTPGGVSDNYNLVVLPTAPSVFHSGVAGPQTNVPTLVRADNNLLVTDANPIHTGDSLVIYLTGLGQTNPAQQAGQPGPTSPLAGVVVPPAVTINGVSLPVLYAGLTPGEVGVYQINVTVPKNTPEGLDDVLTITQGASSTSLTVRVVQ